MTQRQDSNMTEAIAQKIALFSYADTFSIRSEERRQEVAEGGVFATFDMLNTNRVPCPKGSTIKIMSLSLTGEEISDIADWAATRNKFIESGVSVTRNISFEIGVSFEGLKSQHFTSRRKAYESLIAHDGLAAGYGKLITALDAVEQAKAMIACAKRNRAAA